VGTLSHSYSLRDGWRRCSSQITLGFLVVVVIVARSDQVCDNVINDVIDEHMQTVSTNHRPAPAPLSTNHRPACPVPQCSDESQSVDEWLAGLKMTR